jgi:archaeal type IV pilus assembly protein PilA
MKTDFPKDIAVSPVIGVMLMLIITVVIAAAVSGYVGGLANTHQKPPSLLIDASLVNSSHNSLDISIQSVSEGIPTRDIKFITEWRKPDGSLMRNVTDINSQPGNPKYPLGIISNSTSNNVSNFGDYSLLAGVRMTVNTTEGLKSIFGEMPSAGDNVKIQFVHIPSGSIIVNKELTVEGGN